MQDVSSQRRVIGQGWPYGLALALAFALLPLQGTGVDGDRLLLAAGAALLLVGGCVLVPWSRLPYLAGTLAALGAILVIALLRHAAGGGASGYSPLMLLPVVWMALYRTRAEVIAVVAAVSLALVLPILLFGAPEYPDNEWRRAIILGALAGFVGLSANALVAEVRLRRDRERSVMESAAEGILALGPDRRIDYVNPSGAATLGWDPRALVGRACQEIHPDLAPGATARDTFRRRDGAGVPVEYTATAIRRRGSVVGTVVTFSDISDRLEIERMKDEFVAIVGHELRTPLTSIRGSLGLMAGGAFGRLPAEATRMLEIATANTDRLVRLINDILDVQRIEAGKAELELRSVPAAELVARAEEVMRPQAEAAGVRIVAEDLETRCVRADADRIQQTLTNLLSNAIKFSSEGGTVTLRAVASSDGVRFEVADEGRGIPPDRLAHIFDRFEQVDASDARERGGSGLGLAIAQGIVRQHGGELEVRSEVGKGSTFAFVLDAVDARARIVIGGTDAVARRALVDQGFEVLDAADAEAAAALARAARPAAIVLDAALPPPGPWATLAALRDNPDTADVPVLVAATQPDQVVGSLGSGGRLREVLVVEDDAALATVLVTTFERRGVTATAAGSLAEARAALATMAPDLLLLDLGLPDGDGGDLVEDLRESGRLGRTAIVVYTARDVPAEERERLGDIKVVTKSRMAPDDLLALLERVAG